ncbi:MAG: SOS mutagenesis and repair protein UmuC, partial [Rikenellaceae bacterium]
MFLLVDCNNFFVSCERVFRPDLRDKPVVVLSSNDGCIIARSNESKALGIAMGEPFFKVRPILQRNNVAVFSSNMALYADFSRRVMSVLRSVAPSIEVYSIDEAFLNFNGVKEGVDLVE